MNKEQIIDEAYESYTRYPLATIHDHRTNILYQNMHKGWCMLNGRSMASPHPTRHLTKEEFIKKCKTDSEFSKKWGLKIEERELNLDERAKLHPNPENFYNIHGTFSICDSIENSDFPNKDWLHKQFDDRGIPTKLITVTYNNQIIEIYD